MARKPMSFEERCKTALDKAMTDSILQINKELHEAHYYIIRKFYRDYKPRSYSPRGYNLYDGVSYINGKKENTFIKIGNTYCGGIMISYKNLDGDVYNKSYGKNKSKTVSTEWVYDRAFFEGIHGFCKNDLKEWTPIHKDLGFGTAPHLMRPTPKELMESQFRKLVNKKKCNKLIQSNFYKYLK